MFGAFIDLIQGCEEALSDAAIALIGDNHIDKMPHTKQALVDQEIRAIEQIEAEKDPVIKRRMQMYYNNHIYDFSNIRNI